MNLISMGARMFSYYESSAIRSHFRRGEISSVRFSYAYNPYPAILPIVLSGLWNPRTGKPREELAKIRTNIITRAIQTREFKFKPKICC